MASTDLNTSESGRGPLPLLDNGTGPTAERAAPTVKRRARAAGVLLLLAGGLAVGLGLRLEGTKGSSGLEARGNTATSSSAAGEDAARSPGSGRVVALGRVRPQDDIVTVASPFGAGDSRVAQLLVAEGDEVAAGEIVAVLDSMHKYEAALASAESNLEIRRAVLAQTRVQVAAARAETEASLNSAKVAAAAAEDSLRRARSLFERGLVTKEALDTKESAAAAARGDVARLGATLSRYEAGPGDLQVDVTVATADVAAAESAVAQAREDLDLARVRAPRAGTILDVTVRAGEKVPSNGLLRMGDLEHMEAAIEVFEANAPRVQLGQSVSLASGALGGPPLTGSVARIGVLVGRQSLTADDPTANTDARVVEVIVELDAASNARAARYVGLEVVAHIDVSSS